MPLHAAYSASKRALRSLYDSLRMELAAEGSPLAVTTILPASIDTPFFEHSRSKLGAMPKPPAPVYAPELVAEAVLRAAEHPTREMPVGGSAVAFIAAQRFSPALTDAVMSVGKFGYKLQKADRPDGGSDNVDAPLPESGQIRGNFSGHVFRRSPFTSLVASAPRVGDVVTGAIASRRSGRTSNSEHASDDVPAR